MANVLKIDEQISVISALAEGSSIRSIERMTGINRNTIMSLGVRVGKGCQQLLDEKMRDIIGTLKPFLFTKHLKAKLFGTARLRFSRFPNLTTLILFSIGTSRAMMVNSKLRSRRCRQRQRQQTQ